MGEIAICVFLGRVIPLGTSGADLEVDGALGDHSEGVPPPSSFFLSDCEMIE